MIYLLLIIIIILLWGDICENTRIKNELRAIKFILAKDCDYKDGYIIVESADGTVWEIQANKEK